MKTKELLERIFATQVLLYNRLNRIENSLSRFDSEYFGQCEGNDYRENLADISMSIVGITAALAPRLPEPSRRPSALPEAGPVSTRPLLPPEAGNAQPGWDALRPLSLPRME